MNTVYRINNNKMMPYGNTEETKNFINYNEARKYFYNLVRETKKNLSSERFIQDTVKCTESENSFIASGITVYEYENENPKTETYKIIFEEHPHPEEYLEIKHLWEVFHCYDVDGGFGDAVGQKDAVGVAYATEYEIDEYLKKWDKPKVYDRPYASLYHHTVRVQKIEIAPSIDEVIPYSWKDDEEFEYDVDTIKEALVEIPELMKEKEENAEELEEIRDELHYSLEGLNYIIKEADDLPIDVEPEILELVAAGKKLLAEINEFMPKREEELND